MTELVDAVLNEDAKRVAELLRTGADPNEPDEDGTPPLSAAVESDDLVLAERLLAAGADPNGGSLVHAAWGSAASEAVLQRLLVAGADPNQPDESGSTALYAAAVGGNGKGARAAGGGRRPQSGQHGPV